MLLRRGCCKQLQGLNKDDPLMNLQTGAIKCKKPKKEKTPEQEALQDAKKLEKKCLNSNDFNLVVGVGLAESAHLS